MVFSHSSSILREHFLAAKLYILEGTNHIFGLGFMFFSWGVGEKHVLSWICGFPKTKIMDLIYIVGF